MSATRPWAASATYVNDPRGTQCYLKSSVDGWVKKVGVHSGVMPSLPPWSRCGDHTRDSAVRQRLLLPAMGLELLPVHPASSMLREHLATTEATSSGYRAQAPVNAARSVVDLPGCDSHTLISTMIQRIYPMLPQE
ncbi:hypothetical protein GN958_ATG09639 [Phytophthora infestans]|uniref:Uncharacterized protein n=1 Tax=Phytophthora infestans TaxID=4787 RepID=A0A8S9UQ34_PHYIN|nr:hypothetical protein GN958_ATG09639 [Phytophthora infestans]